MPTTTYTVTGKTLDKDHITSRLSVVADRRDFYDDSNKRWLSGILDCIIQSITWSGTKEVGETLTVTVGPPNYDPVANVQTTASPLTTAATATASQRHIVSMNYGVPDPSIWMEGDGTMTLMNVDIALPAGSTSSIVPVITYTIEQSLYRTDKPINGNSYSGTLRLGEKGAADWGMVTCDQQAAAYGAAVVQFTSLATDTVEQFPGGAPAAIFQVSSVPRAAGRQLYSPAYRIPKTAGRTKYFSDAYTYVWAMNNGLIDLNATPVSVPTLSKVVWDLCNYGIAKNPGINGDDVYATFAYLLQVDAL